MSTIKNTDADFDAAESERFNREQMKKYGKEQSAEDKLMAAKLPKDVPISERREFMQAPVYVGGPKPAEATANDIRMGITKCQVLARLELYRAQCLHAILKDMEKG